MHCGKTFISKTDIAEKNCFIFNITKAAAAVSASAKTSKKDISARFNISHNTVNRNFFNDTINYNKKGGINYILIIYNLCRHGVSIFVNHTS